ncbi:MAG: hypothetical protein Q8O05_02520 [Chloroflexota bacterium]|nr:hypothetical protein [Chloroflexota bacterium]
MTVEKKVEAMEGELKLIKGELKESLTSVRDFLLNLKVPTVQVEEVDEGQNHIAIDAGISLESPQATVAEVLEVMPREAVRPVGAPRPAPALPVTPAARAEAAPRDAIFFEKTVPYRREENGATDTEMPLPEAHQPPETAKERPERSVRKEAEEISPPVPQVNLLANLIRWVSTAKREIGMEQLPVFLEVYGISGNLSAELRDVIMYLAEIVTPPSEASATNIWGKILREQLAGLLEINSMNGRLSPDLKEGILRLASAMGQPPAEKNVADVWSQLILELHGILSGGGNQLQPLVLPGNGRQGANANGTEGSWDDEPADDTETANAKEEKEVPAPKEDKPMRLKLVLLDSDGAEKEFNINLAPEVNGDSSK